MLYIAFLRGVNVGGKNIIKMAELKHLLELSGLEDVKTYIQSGNILFRSKATEAVLREKIHKEIADAFHISTPVIMRTAGELRGIIERCPFSSEEIIDAASVNEGESLYVSLLSSDLAPETAEEMSICNADGDRSKVIGRDIYLLLRQSIRVSKLAIGLQKIDIPSTTRNWKTLNKLLAMAEKMGDKGAI